jgi:protein SCO1/2
MMQNSSSIFSTRNIILLVVVISVVLMTIVMAFRLRHEPKAVLANDQVVIFPVGRDIKPFELRTAEDKVFTSANLMQHWTLLLFGFTHCQDVCPASLSMLSEVYNQLLKDYPNLQIVLVSLDPNRDNQSSLHKYMKSFHHDFIGVSGAVSALRKLQSDLGIYAILDDSQGANYQIQHSSSILLINPQGKWVGQFKYGMSPKIFMETFHKSMALASS